MKYEYVMTIKTLEDFINAMKSDAPPQFVMGHIVPKDEPVKPLSNEELIAITQGVIDALERNGWAKGALHRGNSSCMLGAAQIAVCGSKDLKFLNLESKFKIEEWAREISKHFGWRSVPIFNDYTTTTFEIVIERLREFIHEVKGRS